MIQTNQKGFILFECLISLLILSVITTTLVQILPTLLKSKVALHHEQIIFNELYQTKDQFLFHGLSLDFDRLYSYPIPYQIVPLGEQLCAIYSKGVAHETKLCL